MEQNNHSWEEMFRTDTSNMLEDALPYLPNPVKKAAALYVKFTELTKISQEFDNEETLSACGLDQDNASMELLLNAMKLRAPKETSKQLDQMLQMMQMMKMYQSYQSFMESNPSYNKSQNDNDMLSKLMPFFMNNQPQPSNPTSADNDFLNQLNQILKK